MFAVVFVDRLYSQISVSMLDEENYVFTLKVNSDNVFHILVIMTNFSFLFN